jgi:archaellum biogenesis ATPase FlaH
VLKVVELIKEIASKLNGIKRYEVTLMPVDITNYFKVILGTMSYLVNERDMGGVYISTTRPSKAIISRLENENITLKDVLFVDSVSYMSEGPPAPLKNVIFIESPTMLELILIKIDTLLKVVKSNSKFVLFDSINALSIYNSEKILTEFLHLLVNALSAKEASSILLSVKGQTPKDIDGLLRMLCDNVIEIRGDK